jgi:hypothetical protein
MKNTPLPLLAALAAGLAFETASAATIGYWRFEGDFTNQAGTLAGSGGDLTVSGGISTTALAGTGRTSDFFNPIPQTGAANGSTAAGFSTSRRLETEDSTAFDLSADDEFTIEAMINASSTSGVQVIAGQWLAIDGQRSWLFVLDDTQLRLRVSSNGISSELYLSTAAGLGSISVNTDYYVAASFSTTGVTLYLQDLTNGGDLKSQDFEVTLTGIVNPTSPFTIGAYSSNNSSPFSGYIDEVRLSNVALSQSELLAVPEPGTWLTLTAGLSFLCLGRRRLRGR